MTYDKTHTPPQTKRLQDACGIVFCILFASQFVFQLLLMNHVLTPQTSWYAYIVGAISVVGFILLFRLASNMVSDMFALCLLGFEFFFSIGRPFILRQSLEGKEYYSVILYICALFCLVAIYMWSVLFVNNRFKRRDMFFLSLLPLPFVINILGYAGYLSLFDHLDSLASFAIESPHPVLPILRMVLAVFMPVGYWRLSHSECFSGFQEDMTSHPAKMSPFNKFFLIYLAIVVVLLIPVNFVSL